MLSFPSSPSSHSSRLNPNSPPLPHAPPRPHSAPPHRSDRWIPASQQIYKAAADGQKTLSGPDWSDLRFKPGVLKWWLNHVGPTLNLVTVHFYGGDVFSDPSIEDLLSEQTIVSACLFLECRGGLLAAGLHLGGGGWTGACVGVGVRGACIGAGVRKQRWPGRHVG